MYLGKVFSKDGKMDGKFLKHVGSSTKGYSSMWSVRTYEYLLKEVKWLYIKSVLLPVLLYGSENWVCRENHKNKWNVVEMEYLRSVYRKIRRDRVKNALVLNE